MSTSSKRSAEAQAQLQPQSDNEKKNLHETSSAVVSACFICGLVIEHGATTLACFKCKKYKIEISKSPKTKIQFLRLIHAECCEDGSGNESYTCIECKKCCWTDSSSNLIKPSSSRVPIGEEISDDEEQFNPKTEADGQFTG